MAVAAEIVVKCGIFCISEVRRMLKLSRIACAPTVVLMTIATSPLTSASTTCGRPSLTLLIASHASPAARSAPAVPRVASRRKPSAERCRATGITSSLSSSRTLTNTAPDWGRLTPAASSPL